MTRVSLLILIPTIVSLYSAHSQDSTLYEDWRWAHFTTENGLPSNHVYDVVETSDSIPWAVTNYGIAWYDGFKWNTIHDTLGIGNRRPDWIVPDMSGKLIINIKGNAFRGNERGFQRFDIIIDGKKLFVNQIVPLDSNQYMLRSGESIIVCSLKEKEPQVISVTGGSYDQPGIVYTRARGIWINYDRGLCHWSDNKWVMKLEAPRLPYKVKTIVESETGLAYVSIVYPRESNGLWKLERDHPGIFQKGEGHEVVQAMDISPAGEAMTIYESGEIRTNRGAGWSSLSQIPSQLLAVLFIKYRKNSDLWVGTESGLYLHKRSARRWKYWEHPFPSAKNYVCEILRTRDSLIWLGTNMGVEIRNRAGLVIRTIDEIDGTKLYVVTGLCEDDQGNIWISSGSEFNGAYRWDGQQWKHFGIHEGLDTVHFHKIKRDRQGRLWFLGLGMGVSGDSSEPGAFMYSHNKFTHWGTKEGLLNGRVYSFTQTSDSALWFATVRGLCRWKKGVWTYWRAAKELRGGKIFSLTCDSADRVWFGDWQTGLAYIDAQDHVQYVASSEHPAASEIWDLLFDGQGTLWISTRYGEGISSYHDGIWSTFNLSSGLKSLRVWPLQIANDCLFIGTDGSCVSILNFEESTNPKPRIEIQGPVVESDKALLRWKAFTYWEEMTMRDVKTRFRLDDQPWSAWSTQRELELSDIAIGEHRFHIQAKGLFGNYDSVGSRATFSIAAPWYFHPGFAIPLGALSLTVAYLGPAFLLRKRKHTIALRKSEAKFRRLTEATFEGIVIHDNGKILDANQSVLTMFGYEREEFIGKSPLDLTVLESFNTNPGDMLLEGAKPYEAVGIRKDGSIINVEVIEKSIPHENRTVHVAAIRDITERKQAEEKLIAYQGRLKSLASELALTEERERRRMAGYLHDTITQSLAFCQRKLESLRESQSKDEIQQAADELNQLIEQSIEDAQSLTFELSPPILYELGFEDAIEWLCERIQHQHMLRITFDNDKQPKPLNDDIKVVLFNSVRELLVNVVKHAKTQTATVSLKRAADVLEIVVEDKGVGFDHPGSGVHPKTGGGFGLFSIRERLVHLGGRVEINSRIGNGTRVKITASLSPSSHLINN